MKILMVGPKYNGINKYCEKIITELSKENQIERIGFEKIEFEEATIIKKVNKVCEKIEKSNFDIIHYNFGTYDAEQLIPLVLTKRNNKRNYKTILTVHSNQYSLFKKIGNIELFNKINQSLKECDAYIFFTKTTQYRWNLNCKQSVIKLCSTISESFSLIDDRIIDVAKKHEKFFLVIGYASHWKDYNLVVNAAKVLCDEVFVFAGPFWSQKKIPLVDNIIIIDKELNDSEIIFLISKGIGLFPYVYYDDFQGSGMLPNFIINNRPYICNDIKEMVEYIDDETRVCDMNDLDVFCKKILALKNEKIFYKNSLDFSIKRHCELIKDFYKEVTGLD